MALIHPLVADLRALRDLARKYVASHKRPSIDACRELTVKLSLMAEAAEVLVGQAATGVQLEAVARDLDLFNTTARDPAFQNLLKAEQRRLQDQLDAAAPTGKDRADVVDFTAARVRRLNPVGDRS